MNFKRDIANYPLIKKTYAKLHKNLFRYIPHDEFIVAGGFASYLLSLELRGINKIKTDFNLPNPFSDVDVFIYKRHLFDETINGLLKAPACRYTFAEEEFASTIPTDVKLDQHYIILQVVRQWFGSPKKILAGFDFTNVQVGFNGSNVFFSDETEEHIKNRVLVYKNRPKFESQTEYNLFIARLMKYCERGYAVQDPRIIKDFNTIDVSCIPDDEPNYEERCIYTQGVTAARKDLVRGLIKFIPNGSGLVMMNGALWRKL